MSVGNRESSTRGATLVRRVAALVIGFDLLMIVPGTAAWLWSFEVPSPGRLVGVCAGLFALEVVCQDRRLAERVTGTVDDVRELVHDITSASASTVVATARSRSLAENTASAARAIVQAAHQQRADTEHASAGAREFAGIVADTSTAATQTRVAAESLKLQAEQLERLVRRFELRNGPDAGR